MSSGFTFHAPPAWPQPPAGWEPPRGWTPEPTWPPAPVGWVFWRPDVAPASFARTDEIQHLRQQLHAAQAELLVAHTQNRSPGAGPGTTGNQAGVIDLDDQRVLQDAGIYYYHHRLENAAAYRQRLDTLTERIKESVRSGQAVSASELFTYNNSLAKGRKMTADLSKLMLRAYNAEADNAMRTMKAGTMATAVKRLEAAVDSIARLGSMMDMHISPAYHGLRIEELELTQDYLMKVQEEREEAKAQRDQLREEAKVQRELEAQRATLNKEKSHYANLLASLEGSADKAAAAVARAKIAELDQAIADNDYRVANIRAGYVYVISNVGAFGPNVVKIGMTRRLEPLDRVRELGGASVPFLFDVHALYFSEDAVTLETQLHQAFSAMRVNHVNPRKEFFFATPEQTRMVLTEKVGNLLEFTNDPEATQYFQSKKYWPEGLG
ncbi:DUF4041 domain-containing protein [Nakamurella silvestris]|nr:DUF4041 domain-containing protein [Nakamurella silvestris]